ncbi:hypothetical protein FJR38_19270 [Anabaena sp. UHCC 0253]|uniref:hypothetical protein n=1 Tax=Anabaena sp. UHCC 0253 TaxID=2590019 RepID=UPI001445D71C|nr:hypothetical protein [Anabaena sp. UHCC 0253]MTJ54647.1 hypothetical protein [Anabaena sp. UHCC 0253]
MKRPFLPVHKIIIATIAGISFASILIAKPTLANPNQPFGSPGSDGNSNPLSGNASDFNMFNLIHQAQFGNLQWNANEQSQQLDQAAAAFKAAQQKRLQTQSQQNPGASEVTNTLPLQILPLSGQ